MAKNYMKVASPGFFGQDIGGGGGGDSFIIIIFFYLITYLPMINTR